MATLSPSNIHPYSWEEVYKAAVLEPDNELLEQHIRVAEEMIVTRWLELTNRHEHELDVQAIVDALKALRNLKRERLGYKRKAALDASPCGAIKSPRVVLRPLDRRLNPSPQHPPMRVLGIFHRHTKQPLSIGGPRGDLSPLPPYCLRELNSATGFRRSSQSRASQERLGKSPGLQ